MGWFRTNRKGAAWLAFFALACQLLLSFGHIHLGKVNGGGAASWAMAANGGDSGTVPQPTPLRSPTGFPDDFCAICASIGMASALVIPEGPAVPAPAAAEQILPWSIAATAAASFDHFLFDARGPPQD